ncbi:hypothetical protein EJ06DRAFT_1952 [Trichodelitschia bisporula]|uniref:Uncharacterized protein n=1 Tax=Trichodelitschia bisporula TaxID=703511 RepID=A0A6G1I9L7_9PEZI|nr:hypothetical protein EJ06DRAFT_1952 [Trichodelitschia bisporula]
MSSAPQHHATHPSAHARSAAPRPGSMDHTRQPPAAIPTPGHDQWTNQPHPQTDRSFNISPNPHFSQHSPTRPLTSPRHFPLELPQTHQGSKVLCTVPYGSLLPLYGTYPPPRSRAPSPPPPRACAWGPPGPQV